MACVGCTRWLVVPWLVMYLLNILFLIGVALGMATTPYQTKMTLNRLTILNLDDRQQTEHYKPR